MKSSDPVDSSNKLLLCCGLKRTHGMEKQHKSVGVGVESAEPPLVPGLESLRSQDFIHFESRNLIYKQLLEAMERNYMTGLHGIEGIGKTTLAKEVCLKLHESIKFDHVIFITVSKCSNIKEIRDVIAANLRLSLEGNNEWERTETIMKRLMNGDRILLILDDVREYINTEELGIPPRPNKMMKCRVLVTSCGKELCMSVGCRRSIQVDKLSMKEALMSFKEHAGINDNSSQQVQDLGKEITERCQGLPLIVGIASILKGRPLEEWKLILSYLSQESRDYDKFIIYFIMGGFDKSYKYLIWEDIKAYAFLTFSHDDLTIDKARRLSFLLSMFPRNTQVPIEMLTRLGIGVGLFGEVEIYSQVRGEVLKLIHILIDSHVCFQDERGHVKMNAPFRDMIRNRATSLRKIQFAGDRWVSFITEENIHYLYYGDLRVKEMEFDPFPVWSGYDGIKVEMLLITIEASNSLEVLDALFEKMTRLQVLSLSSNNLHPMHVLKIPSSLQSLTNIRSLLLSHWKLCDISILGKLQSLDTLDFDDCSIYEFPKEISTLKLRLLSLKRCQIEKNNPFEVIERCLSLQELYYKDNKVSTSDSVNEDEEIYECGTFPTLKRYHLQGVEDDSKSKCVCLPSIDALVSKATFKYLIQGAEILRLKEIWGEWRNLIPEIVSSMNDVVELCLESCSKVECLVNNEQIKSRVASVFSGLVELKLASMDNLKQLCSGTFPYDFLEFLERLSVERCAHLQGTLFRNKVNLCNLKSVNLVDCHMLTSLFQLSTALRLVLLVELRIQDCKLLTTIIEDDENDCKSNDSIFPNLESIEIEGCERLECIFPVAFPRGVMLLTNIKISKCPKLKDIFYEEHGDVKISSLQKVELSDVSHLFNISIECYPLSASRLKRSSPRFDLKVKQQDPSKTLISQGLNMPIVRNIKQLVLKDLHKIKYLFTLSSASSMKLEILIVDSCNELKHIIDIGDGHDGKKFEGVFRKLKELSVSRCNQLECMFGKYAALDDKNYKNIHTHLPALKKLTLQELPEFSLSSVTWTSLKEFVLVQCPDFIINPISAISDMMIHFDSRKLVSTTFEDIRDIDKHFLTLETLHIKGYEAESVFCVSGVEIIGQVRLGLQCLKLSNLPRMLYICVGSRSSFFFQNLKKVQIVGCKKLKVIFPAFILSYLPKLEVLEIQDCEELEQIIEEDKKLGNVDSPQPCFPKLAVLVVESCYNLKRLIPAFDVPNVKTIRTESCLNLEVIFPDSVLSCLPELTRLEIISCYRLRKILEEDKNSPRPCFPKLVLLFVIECYNLKHIFSASNDVPNLELLIIVNANKLEELIGGGEQGQGDDVSLEKMEVKLPKLKYAIFAHLSKATFKEGIELQTIRHCFVYDCPKLSLKATATFKDVEEKLLELFNIDLKKHLSKYRYDKMAKVDVIVQSDVAQTVLGSDVPSSQNELELSKSETYADKENEGHPPNIQDFKDDDRISSSQPVEENGDGQIPIPSMSVITVEHSATNGNSERKESHELEDGRSMSESCLMNQQKPLGETEIPQSELELSKSETYTDKENEGHPTNIQDFKDNDPIISSQPVEEDGQIPTPYVSVINAEHSATNDNSVVKILADLEKYLKMPLKDLASSKANSLSLLTALNFLSHFPSEDKTVSHELKATIDSLHQEFLSILPSLKRAFATANNFAVLEETEKSTEEELARLSGVAITLDSEISKVENFIDEAQKKEAILKKQIISLEIERKESHDLEDGRPMSESCLMNQQKPLGETEITTEIPQSEIGLKQGLIDFKESLNMPLKDIANSKANSLRLLTSINFLSNLHLDPLHQEYPSILCSFKQVFATIKKIALLEPNMNEVATMLVSKISKAETFIGEAQQKEATLKENIIRLEKATPDLPIGLGSQTMSGNDLPSQINEESKKEFVGKGPHSEIPETTTTTTTSPTDLNRIETPTSSPLDNNICKAHLHELGDGQSMSESCLMNQQKPIGENESTIGIPQSIERGVEEGTRSENAKMVASATHSESANSQSYPHSEIWLKQCLIDFQESLKMSLKDIACTEGNSRRLLTALDFLSNSTLEDVTLSDGLKAIIVSMHKEPESILCSFKQVFATVNKFVMLEPYLNEVATMKEQINRLQNEIKDFEAKLSSLQEEKKKCIAETKRYKEENYNVKKDKSKMLEDQRKAQEVLIKVHYGWSALCSQFELDRIAAI